MKSSRKGSEKVKERQCRFDPPCGHPQGLMAFLDLPTAFPWPFTACLFSGGWALTPSRRMAAVRLTPCGSAGSDFGVTPPEACFGRKNGSTGGPRSGRWRCRITETGQRPTKEMISAV